MQTITNSYPLVSICIPAFKPSFFLQTLRSAIGQSYPRFEVIVSDDSNDDAIEKLTLNEKHPSIKYVKNPNPGNNGRNNINGLIKLANGDFIKFLFDDDILHPFCVERLVTPHLLVKSRQSLSMSFSIRSIIDERNQILGTVNPLEINMQSILDGKKIVEFMARHVYNPIGELTTVLIPRSLLESNSTGLDIFDFAGWNWKGLGDVALWIRLSESGNFFVTPEVLSYFRRHPQSNTNWSANPELFFGYTDWERVVNYYYKNFSNVDFRTIEMSMLKIVKNYQTTGNVSLKNRAELIINLLREKNLSGLEALTND
jgi:glycosyltransferase involved in cell wall biosynthesis